VTRIECARAEDFLASLPDASVSLIVTDPPYHRVKSEAWDNQWNSDAEFLDWMRGLCREWRRVLRPNGSIYVFASPRMAWGVEGVVREFFEVLNSLTWAKPLWGYSHTPGRASKEALRAFFPWTERVTFAEQRGSDAVAASEAGYGMALDKLRGSVFEPIRAYLDGERIRAGLSLATMHEAWCKARNTKGHMVGHWFGQSQWALPTRANYEWIRSLSGPSFFARDYEALRVDYEALRRPFTVSASVPYTDVWTYPTVPHYPGKHVCEKPLQMALDIVRASSRPGDVVLDSFAGSGPFLAAAAALGRIPWGCDMDPHWVETTRERVRLSAEVWTVVDLRGVRKAARPKPTASPAAPRLPAQGTFSFATDTL
jgi:site-specific DNA-methyltransferase (adenine-specific)